MLVYRILSVLLFPFIELYLFYRVAKKKEDKKRLKERFGNPTQPRVEGELVWLHAVSVGETNSSLILVEELLKSSPNISILFTTTTLTSAAILAQKIPDFRGRVIHQFLPVDSFFCVKNFLDFWRPRAAIFVESEIWPNLIFEARKSGAATFLVNARMSEKSAKKWRIARMFGFKIFDQFTKIFAQTSDDKNRFEKLTNQEILFFGNLKSQAQNLTCDVAKLDELKSQIGSRKIFVAASTHKGEEEIVIAAHQTLKKEFPDLLTILIPRHPNRADEIKNLFAEKKFAQRSKNEKIASATEIYLADTLGELGTFYSLADFTFLGGSLVEVGGHNPFEPIKLGCAVISGSHVFNFKEIYQNLAEKNACVIVDSQEKLIGEVRKFLQDEQLGKALADKASNVIKNSENIAEKIVGEMVGEMAGEMGL
jgi:3-deoxy-D-manno-octulosonic-acid transferase